MHHDYRNNRGKLYHEIAVAHPVERIARGTVEAQLFRRVHSVRLIGGAGKGAAAQRTFVHIVHGVYQLFDVAQKHLRIGAHMVRERYGLGALQVRISRHDRARMLFGNGGYGFFEFEH